MTLVEARDAYDDLIRDGATHPAKNIEMAWERLRRAVLDDAIATLLTSPTVQGGCTDWWKGVSGLVSPRAS